jgi:hypothetical protein
MDYSRAIEKRDYAKIDKLNDLIHFQTFWDDVGRLTKGITSDHSINRWQCLAEYRYKEISDIWSNLMRKLYEEDRIVFRCTEPFKGMYKAERDDIFADYIKIHSKDEMFVLYNDKIGNRFGEIFYRINEAKMPFYCEGFVLEGCLLRAIDKGILEEVKDFEFPKVEVYSLEEILTVK